MRAIALSLAWNICPYVHVSPEVRCWDSRQVLIEGATTSKHPRPQSLRLIPLWRRFNKYLASLQQLLSKFQPNRTHSFVFTACGKWNNSNIGRWFDFVFGKEILHQNQRALGCSVWWHYSFNDDCQKVGWTIFNVVACRILISHVQVPQSEL